MKAYRFFIAVVCLIVASVLSPFPAFSIQVIEYFDTYISFPEDSFNGVLEVIYEASESSPTSQTFAIMFGASYSQTLLLDPPNYWGAVLANIEYNELTGEYTAMAFGRPIFRNLPDVWSNYSKGYLYYTHDGFINGPDPVEDHHPKIFEAVGNGVELTLDFVYYDKPIKPPLPAEWQAVEPTGSGTMVALCQGEGDDDDVDGTNLWDFNQSYGTADLDNDFNGDGVVNDFDFVIFTRHLGRIDCP
jgi:hypothetical protein